MKLQETNDASALIAILEEMEPMHAALSRLGVEKLEAVRSADIRLMQEIEKEERAILERIHRCESRRRETTRALVGRLPVAPKSFGTHPVSEIARHLTEPSRGKLLEVADRLRGVMKELARQTRMVASASHGVLRHLQWVMSSVRPAKEEAAGYSPVGRTVVPAGAVILDTLG